MLIGLAGKDCSLNAHHGQVGVHTFAAQNTLCAAICEPPRTDNMASGLLAGCAVGEGDRVEDVHRFWVWFQLELPANLRRRKNAALGPERLARLAGGGNRGAVAAILAAADVAEVSGAVAADFVGCEDRVHCRFWVWLFTLRRRTASSAPALRVDAPRRGRFGLEIVLYYTPSSPQQIERQIICALRADDFGIECSVIEGLFDHYQIGVCPAVTESDGGGDVVAFDGELRCHGLNYTQQNTLG